MALEYINPVTYRDPSDGKILILDIETSNGVHCLSVKKVIDQNHCLRPEVRDDEKTWSNPEHPTKFYEEAKDHSCEGIDWKVYVPINLATAHIGEYEVKPEGIEGMVQDPDKEEGVWLAPEVKKAVESQYDLGKLTAEEYVWENRNSLCRNFTQKSFETPFTKVFGDLFTNSPLFKITKTCGYVSNYDDFKHLKIVQEQFADKVKDIERLYPELREINVLTVSDYLINEAENQLMAAIPLRISVVRQPGFTIRKTGGGIYVVEST